MRIAVAGGTGTVGRLVVARARAAGHDVVALSRAGGVDLRDSESTLRALEGAEAVVDAASVGTTSAASATDFFHSTATSLLAASVRAGVRNLVVLSIVGVDRNPHGYYAGKVAQEEVYTRGAAPWTLLRATQFHEFAGQVAGQAAVGPVQLAPRARVQPVAADAVAARLVELAVGAAQGRVRDIAGPREERLDRMIRAWVHRTGSRRPVIPVSLPGKQMKGMRRGLVLPERDADLVGPAFDDWLAGQPRS